MFDDQNKPQGVPQTPQPPVPPTPPMAPMPSQPTVQASEPDDMFANINTGTPAVPTQTSSPTPPIAVPPSGLMDSAPKKKGKLGLIIAIVVIVLVLGIGGYFVYSMMMNAGDDSNVVVTPPVSTDSNGTQITEPTTPEVTEPVTEPEATTPVFNIDSDGDGISNEDELALGTNPNSLDSDGDGLFDGEETKIYFTNPTNPDSDGDSYLDGEEVANGFDPNGPGRLFEIIQ